MKIKKIAGWQNEYLSFIINIYTLSEIAKKYLLNKNPMATNLDLSFWYNATVYFIISIVLFKLLRTVRIQRKIFRIITDVQRENFYSMLLSGNLSKPKELFNEYQSFYRNELNNVRNRLLKELDMPLNKVNLILKKYYNIKTDNLN